MRADRLMATVLLLQRRGRATAPELAEALEVSVRTVHRDIAALQAAGVPLWTEPGPRGGVRLVEGWRMPGAGLTAEEAAALFLTGVPGAAAELGLGAVMATAQVKLLETLPPELHARASRVRERFHLDAPGWFQRTEPLPHLAVVAEGVWGERRLEVAYGRGPDVRPRRLDPLGLVLKSGTWYLVAATGGTPRTYRLGRITAATVLDERFERPPGFDLAAWWERSSREFDRSILRLDVRLRLGPGAVRVAAHALPGVPVAEVLAAAGPPDEHGWWEVTLPLESEEVARSQLVALAPDVEVLEPVSLRAALRDAGLALAARHGTLLGVGPPGGADPGS